MKRIETMKFHIHGTRFFYTLRSTKGQLLLEALISLLVGGLFLVAATLSVVSLIRYNFESRISGVTAIQAADTINYLEQFALSDWQSLKDLGTEEYFIVHGATSSLFVEGRESILVDDITYGLVGHWGMDETATTTAYDTSGNMIIGTAVNNPAKATSSCLIGDCLRFNGTDTYVDLGLPTELKNLEENFTISAWVQVTNFGPPTTTNGIITWGEPGEISTEPFIGIRADYGSNCNPVGPGFTFRIVDDSGTQIDGHWGQEGTFCNVAVDTWYFLTLQIGPSGPDGLRGYVNGNLEISKDTTLLTGNSTSTANWLIGYNERNDNYFDGLIDDVRVYNRALSANEIKQLYQSRSNTRYFTVTDVYRDGNGDMTTTAGGNTLDPSSLLVESTGETDERKTIAYQEYITRKNSYTLSQTNWSDGGNITGPATTTPGGFATSSNIAAGTSLVLATTTASGWLESTIYDTQAQNGAALHSIFWDGTLPSDTVVKFQIAPSNSDSGPWSYIGPDGTGTTYFTPSAPDAQTEILNSNTYRYFRYKIFLEPNSGNGPTIDDIHINWAV